MIKRKVKIMGNKSAYRPARVKSEAKSFKKKDSNSRDYYKQAVNEDLGLR